MTDYDDLIARLDNADIGVCDEAAAELRRLRAERDALRSVVRRICALANNERLDWHRIGFDLVGLLSPLPSDRWSPAEAEAIRAAVDGTTDEP